VSDRSQARSKWRLTPVAHAPARLASQARGKLAEIASDSHPSPLVKSIAVAFRYPGPVGRGTFQPDEGRLAGQLDAWPLPIGQSLPDNTSGDVRW